MKKALLILLVLVCVLLFSIKVQAQRRHHHRPIFYVNVYGNNNVYFPSMRPIICIVNQYNIYLDTVYYVDWYGYRTGRGYNIYRYYTVYSNGVVTYIDTYTYF